MTGEFKLKEACRGWQGTFTAMANPCEVLIDGGDRKVASKIVRIAWQEAKRVEQHWSRYRDDSIIGRINNAQGQAVEVDPETADMLDYAQQLWLLSARRFDITSGVLRQAWRFDGSANVPAAEQVSALLDNIGWQRAQWQRPTLTLPVGMELDFGGIGKEYAVDRSLELIRQQFDLPVLVNYGGDLACREPRADGSAWQIGLDHSKQLIPLFKGGIASSGDSRRFLLKDGQRYSHILDANTGWPVPDAPNILTVISDNCTLAGMLATLGSMQGAHAEEFLRAQKVGFVIDRQ